MTARKAKPTRTGRVIQDYQAARESARSASEELDALSKHHAQIVEELKTLREKIEHSNAVIQELRSKHMRGLSTEDDLTRAKKERQELLDALNETLEMDSTAQKIAGPLRQQAQQQQVQLRRFKQNAWDAVAQLLYTEVPALPDQWLRAYAAAKNGTFPPGSLGAWLDRALGNIDTEEHARDVAAEYGL